MNIESIDPQAARLERYIRRCARIVGLGHWDITYDATETVRDAWAQTQFHEGNHAVLSFGVEYWAQSREERRLTIAHELAHFYLVRFENLRRVALDGLGAQARELYGDQWQEIEEESVQRIARVLAPLLPLPPG